MSNNFFEFRSGFSTSIHVTSMFAISGSVLKHAVSCKVLIIRFVVSKF